MDGEGKGGVHGEGEVRGSRPSNVREQEEDKRELGEWSCKRRCTVEAAYDQNVGSREAKGGNGRRRRAKEGP